MTLQILMDEIEGTTGLFSTSYKTIDEHNHKGHVYNIAFELKPAQQLLAGLGALPNQQALLSSLTPGHTAIDYKDVAVKSFSPKDSEELIIAADRIKRLHRSAKIYVNTDLCPAGLYAKAMQQHLVNRKDSSLSDDAQIHWQNLAAGVCHAQEIDLLVDASISKSGRALTTARKGVIGKDAPAILLLSNPTLKFKHGLAKKLDKETRLKFIEGMYRNIFNAAISSGRNYIVMPAAGLGKSGGKPDVHFAALMTVAKNFPNLNIIYNPDKHAKKFDEALLKAKLDNVVKATKNVVFIADKLTRQGKPCALFSPCDSDVIYGHCDVGDNWKLEKNSNFDGKNYIGATTTAALNSHGLNPHAWKHILERSLTAAPVVHKPETPVDISKAPSKKIDKPLPTPNTTPSTEPKLEVVDETKHTSHIETPVSNSDVAGSIEIKPTLPEKPVDEGDLSASKPIIDIIIESKSGGSGLFKPDSLPDVDKSKDKPERSHFNEEQIDAIRAVISGLEREIQSCWPYPNKDLKQIKVDALEALIIEAQTHPIEDAIKAVKKACPRVMEGSFSTRTADLLDRLAQEARGMALLG